MSVDITSETSEEYENRLRKMSSRRLKGIMDYYREPGYNCSGLVTADDFITPRWAVAQKILIERHIDLNMDIEDIPE